MIQWIFRAVVVGVLFLAILGLLALFGQARWWVAAPAAVAVYALVAFGARAVVKRLFAAPFEAKGAVLKGAQAEVHSVGPADAPPPEEGDDEDSPREGLRHFWVEATVTPAPSKGPFTLWEPGELALVPFEAAPGLDGEAEGIVVHRVELFQDGAFVPDEGLKVEGTLRLRCRVSAAPGVARAKFRYYFEEFGELRLP